MIVDKPGKVTDRIVLLGRKESWVYLLKGEKEYVILGGGMVHIVPDLIEQFKTLKVDEEKIKRIVILHSHFDHCGIVSFFTKRWPWIRVVASARAKELLSAPKVIETISFLNQTLIEKYGREDEAVELGLTFNGIDVDDVVKEGDILSCGDVTMEVIEVPGHSSCSIAIYVREERALFASDAGGIPFGEKIFTAANSNFDRYQESLKKMAGYAPEIYLAEHFGALTGPDGQNFLTKSIDSAEETRRILEESLARTQDVKASTAEMTEEMMAKLPGEILPKEIISLVVGQMLAYLKKQRDT